MIVTWMILNREFLFCEDTGLTRSIFEDNHLKTHRRIRGGDAKIPKPQSRIAFRVHSEDSPRRAATLAARITQGLIVSPAPKVASPAATAAAGARREVRTLGARLVDR